MNYSRLLKSRTFWTLVIMFLINGLQGIRSAIPESWMWAVDGVLSIAAIYYAKISPRIDLNQ